MTNRIPKISASKQICIVCEGNEEYKYLERLNELHVWNSLYAIRLDNAEGNGNIVARYQDNYQNGTYDAVFVFCDTEKKPHEQYKDIKTKINNIHGSDVAKYVVIFANPCTMRIILKHWTEQNIKSPAKQANAPFIEKCTNVVKYKGRKDQIKEIMNKITINSYKTMKDRVRQMSSDDEVCGSTNFFELLKNLESADDKWIDDLNDKLVE